ncbi:MAG: S8 family serine peptidase [Candidatus Firestonebacteria bacterium]
MKKYLLIFAGLLILCPFAQKAAAEAGHRKTHPAYVEDEILVKFENNINPAAAGRILQRCAGASFAPASGFDGIGKLGYRKIKLPKGKSAPEALAEFRSEGSVKVVELNSYFDILVTPNDTNYGLQWCHPKMQSPQGWDLFTGGSNITVAIIDTGVNYNHEDLAGKVVQGYDFYNNDADPMDDHSHGTHCAGIAAAVSNNGKGVAGVSWGAVVLAVKSFSATGTGSDEQVVNGIIYAADNGARVISMSFGDTADSQMVHDAIIYAANKGCLLVASRGNDGTNVVNYPAAYPEVMAVSATDSSDALASFSSYGNDVAVAAPGVSIYSTVLGNAYANKGGTSMSCPQVAGLAALIWSKMPSLTREEIRTLIQEGADDIGAPGYDQYFGNGRINVYKTLLQFKSVDRTKDNTLTFPARSGASLSVSIPARTFTEDITLTAIPLATVPNSGQPDLLSTQEGFELSSSNSVLTAGKNITITLKYTHAGINGFDESKLVIGYFDESRNRWIALQTAKDIAGNTLTAVTSHFSKYAVLQLVPASNLESSLVYPNPFKPGSGSGGVTFGNLTPGVKIKIFTVSGESVRELEETDNDGVFLWDARNSSGENVAAGIYFYILADPAGRKKTGKLAVLR